MPIPSTVIVPSHNRLDDTAETVRHLLEARSRGNFEVVVIDDGSDSPLSITFPGVQVIRTEGIERSRARNLGACSAKGDLLIFLDDDITVRPDFVEIHENAAGEFGDVLCVGGISVPPEIAQSAFGRFRHLIENPSQAHSRGPVAEKNFCTAQNMSMRKDTFLSMGGFDPNIVSSEDQDLALRFSARKGRIVFLPEASAVHRDINADVAAYCRRNEWGSRAMAPFLRRYPEREDNRHRLRFESGFSGAETVRDRVEFAARAVLSRRPILRLLLAAAAALERGGASDRALFPMYRVLLGLHLFRGFRRGLSEVKHPPPLPTPIQSEFPK